jgi:hypothetical protein
MPNAELALYSLKRQYCKNRAATRHVSRGWHATCVDFCTLIARRKMTANRSKASDRPKALGAPMLLVLAQPSPETDDLLAPLVERADLCLLRVVGLNAAEIALRDVAVSLVLVCPETDVESVTAILDRTDELRRGTPMLVLRPRGAEHPSAWKGRTVAVLHGPILSDVLNRTVDVVLGLGAQPAPQSRSR